MINKHTTSYEVYLIMSKDKRDSVEAYILELADQIDSTGTNSKRYAKMFASMNNKQFDDFMHNIKTGHTQIHMILPNLTDNISTNKAVQIAKERNVKIFSKVQFHDMHSGRKYSSKYEMLILKLPVRRLSQYLFHKISLPEGDNHINPTSGQVISPDKGSALSAIEVQVLASKGLSTSIIEMIKMRGGDNNAYNSMKHTIEEQGTCSMSDVPMLGRPRSVITARRYFHAMGISSNL